MANLLHCSRQILALSVVMSLTFATTVSGDCTCHGRAEHRNKREALKFKLVAIASVLTAGAIGVSLPLLGRKLRLLQPEHDVFFMIKAFAAGVILATGFIHVLPDAFGNLTSPCLAKSPWHEFPFTGFIAMVASIGTLAVDTLATAFYKDLHSKKTNQVNAQHEENGNGQGHDGHVHAHVHAPHGHPHGGDMVTPPEASLSDIVRQRIISQVLELGIVVHSVIIGISLGASESPGTIKPLLFALSFHQFFEGMGLGGCISQAKFKSLTTIGMTLFFSLTTPIGIGIGIGISSVYRENSTRALVVEGVLNSASAGILIYMALVDILAADFMNPRLQSNARLQLAAHASLLLGAGCMSFLAKWA